MTAALELRTLTDGGQRAADIGAGIVGWLGAAERTLDLALYDVRLPGPVGDAVAGALRAAKARGVRVRIAIHDPHSQPPGHTTPPPATKPDVLAGTEADIRRIDGDGELMHHKFVVRDGAALWCGSTNWTLDSWSREENVIVTAASAPLAAAYERTFEQLWTRRHLENTGNFDTRPIAVGDASVRPWFCPGRGPELAHRIAAHVDRATRRVRVASPVLTSAPVLSALAEVLDEHRVDATGVVDLTQCEQALRQWRANDQVSWKAPILERVLAGLRFSGKRSTPYAPGSVHDFMHAKTSVVDDVVFVGSFNLSRSGEENAENVLEIADPALADRVAAWIDEVRARYPAAR
ncbi:MAG TPA: phospholipase D-like domain-containing protein [Solirubrobacteraceae bacterium]